MSALGSTFKLLGCALSLTWAACVMQAQVLSGDGYINLAGGPTPWTASGVLSGPRFVWSPANNAMRIGNFTGATDAWATGSYVLGSGSAGISALSFLGNAGNYSIAIGDGASAATSSSLGVSGIAIGRLSNASNGGIAIGTIANAAGLETIAIGKGAVTSGLYSTSIRGSALGSFSFAYALTVQGTNSVGFGGGGTTGIWANRAFTYGGTVYADDSVALGVGSSARSRRSIALGKGNDFNRQDGTLPDPVVESLKDPILMVGNWDSTPGATQKNALTVYRNNDAHLNGVLRVRPGGDVSMGSFTAVPAGVVFP
jgi:hypothetical protein